MFFYGEDGGGGPTARYGLPSKELDLPRRGAAGDSRVITENDDFRHCEFFSLVSLTFLRGLCVVSFFVPFVFFLFR